MALILITIQDRPNGSVAVQMSDEPKVQADQTEFSPAQHIATAALNAIHQQLNAVGKNTIDLSAAPSTQEPKLIIAGSDEVL